LDGDHEDRTKEQSLWLRHRLHAKGLKEGVGSMPIHREEEEPLQLQSNKATGIAIVMWH